MLTERSATQNTEEVRHSWTLTQGAFDCLLARLGPDRENGGKAYEELRDRLIRFFQPHALLHAEHWADVVLDRVAKRNQDMQIANLNGFVWGVARMVRSEIFRANKKCVAIDETREVAQVNTTDEDIDRARRSESVGQAVRRLPTGEFKLLLGWYSSYEKASQRQQLALSLGISVASLRVKAHRARLRLRRIVIEKGF